jgi:hypothetical protein
MEHVRSLCRPLAAATAVVALAALVTEASASVGIKPPRNIPDLSKMALRASDLPAGAKVKKQGYVGTSSVAEYDRTFAARSVRVGGKRLLSLESEISLETSALAAASEFAQLRRLLSSKGRRKQIANAVKKELGAEAESVRVGLPYRFGVGEESLAVTITVDTILGTVQETLSFFRIDRVVSILVSVGDLDVTLSRGNVTVLTRPIGAHIKVGLLPLSTAPPAIAGGAVAGQTLTVVSGTWVNGPVSFAYQWQRCDGGGANCVDIPGATSPTYLLLDDDAGSTVRVDVTVTNAFGSAVRASAPTGIVTEPAAAPVSLTPPSITGAAAPGQTLTASNGVWVGKPAGFTYQWQRCDPSGGNCTSIDLATAQTYVVGPADAGSTVRVAVTASNTFGSTTIVSPQTPVVTGG